MTAISKAWVSIADAAVDPDSPVDTALMTGLRDDLIHLREWLGASFFAGAVQDHNHDGVNSALLEVGPNYQRNGSFESGTVSWTTTAYTGGTVATNTVNDMDGATALAFTSTVLANGGGDAISAAFMPVTGGSGYVCKAALKASAAGVSSKIEVIWYSDAQAQISSTTAYAVSDTLTTMYVVGKNMAAPVAARYAKVKITGGVPATGSSTGTIYADGIVFAESPVLIMAGTTQLAASNAEASWATTTYTKLKDIQVPLAGWIYVTWEQHATSPETSTARIYLNGVAYGTEHATASTSYVAQAEYIPVSAGDLVQLYVKTSGTSNAYVKNFALSGDRPPVFTVNL